MKVYFNLKLEPQDNFNKNKVEEIILLWPEKQNKLCEFFTDIKYFIHLRNQNISWVQ